MPRINLQTAMARAVVVLTTLTKLVRLITGSLHAHQTGPAASHKTVLNESPGSGNIIIHIYNARNKWFRFIGPDRALAGQKAKILCTLPNLKVVCPINQ